MSAADASKSRGERSNKKNWRPGFCAVILMGMKPQGNLVHTVTRDDVRLDGAFLAAERSGPPAIDVDAFLLIHGTGGNFYSSTLFDAIAERLLQLGCAILRVNTRGHDGISTAVTSRGGRRAGAAYEVVDECRHDIAAWLDWLRQRAGPRIGLIGHSSGAVKCLYAVAHEPQLPVADVIAISPPRLSYSWFCTSARAQEFLDTYQRAEQLVNDGTPAALMDVKLPLPFVVTAAGYLEKYGPDERYNFLKFLAGVPCPALVTLGEVEVADNMAFHGLPGAVAEIAARRQGLRVETIPGADHFYTGTRPALIARMEEWLRHVDSRH
jgi:pimeloyl-ACP methyl ester carboxylesterase